MRRLVLLGLLLVVSAARAEDAPPRPLECPIKALLAEDDAGLRRVYDGIRRGLEQAELPRICLETLAEGEAGEAVLDRLAVERPPLLFVLGAVAAERLGDRLPGIPRVHVDVAWRMGGRLYPPPVPPRQPAALVRGVLTAARLGEVIRDMLGRRPGDAPAAVVGLWPAETRPEALVQWRTMQAAFEREAQVQVVTYRPEHEEDRPRAVLDLALFVGRRTRSLEPTPASIAGPLGVPSVSDRLEHWRGGAAVLVLPDHHLLGRVAADVGRRLLTAPAGIVLEREVLGAEVRVDLETARRGGYEPPLPFLAGADVLRRGAPVPPPPRGRE